jgi:hypothetical protein
MTLFVFPRRNGDVKFARTLLMLLVAIGLALSTFGLKPAVLPSHTVAQDTGNSLCAHPESVVPGVTPLPGSPTPGPWDVVPELASMEVSWALAENRSGEPGYFDTVFEGMWFLPQGSGVAIRGAQAAAIRVLGGNITVLACGDDGKIDPVEHDGTLPVAFVDEETRYFEWESYFYLEFGPGTTEFWIFGAESQVNMAFVHIETLGANGEASICDLNVCSISLKLAP